MRHNYRTVRHLAYVKRVKIQQIVQNTPKNVADVLRALGKVVVSAATQFVGVLVGFFMQHVFNGVVMRMERFFHITQKFRVVQH